MAPLVMPSSSSDAGLATPNEPRSTPSKELRNNPSNEQSKIEYWLSTADDDAETLEYRRQQDRERKEQQKRDKQFTKQFGVWKPFSSYKPSISTNFAAYRATGAYRSKLADFDAFLQRMSRPSRPRQNSSDSAASVRPTSKSSAGFEATNSDPEFVAAPKDRASPKAPSVPSFAPPISYDPRPAATPTATPNKPSPPAFYSGSPPPPPPEAPAEVATPPPPPPPAPAPYNPTISAPPVRYSHVIVGAPVHYAQPPVVASKAESTEQERPAKRQKVTEMSKAEAMMAKMGYKKGEGLGKNNDGVTTALSVKPRKQQTAKKDQVSISDDYDDKSMQIKSQQVYDILGGTITKRKEPDRFGDSSKVVVAWGCIDGVDWTTDADRNDGGIRQKLGQTFDEKVRSVVPGTCHPR
jgi:splicing factor 45